MSRPERTTSQPRRSRPPGGLAPNGLVVRLLLVLRHALRDLLKNGLLASPAVPNRLRPYLLRPFGVLAIGASIAPHVFIGSGWLEIGEGSAINYEVFFDAVGGILLGAHVKVGPRAMFITQTHLIGPTQARRTERGPGTLVCRPIVVGDNVWVVREPR